MILKAILSMFIAFQSSILSPCPPPKKKKFSFHSLMFPFAFSIVYEGTYVLLFNGTFYSIFLISDHLLFKEPLSPISQ